MIHFKRARWKNLMRYGDQWTSIDLDRSPSTVILGKNGAGKSAINEALCFALFGRPYRKIKKGQLINAKNGKGLEVELEFSIDGKEFLIRRTMKPDSLEVFEDGALKNAPGSVRDYQKILENEILHMDYASACQIMFVGKAQHTTFMQLNGPQRRQFVEVLLNLVIFSKMSSLMYTKNGELRNKISDLKTAVSVMKEKTAGRRRLLVELETQSRVLAEEQRSRIATEIAHVTSDIEPLHTLRGELLTNQKEIGSVDALRKETHDAERLLDKEQSFQSNTKKEIDKLLKRIESAPSECYACSQPLPEAEVKRIHDADCSKMAQLENQVIESQARMDAIRKTIQIASDKWQKSRDIDMERSRVDAQLEVLTRRLRELEQQQKAIDTEQGNEKIEEIQQELQRSEETHVALQQKLEYVTELNGYHSVINSMLKDTGIKANLISRVIPIVNQIVNEKMVDLGLSAKFHINELFEETITVGVDQYNYYSLSEGEKLRIDMAVLIAWRVIAKMYGNVSSNLLFFDEVFDSSLDTTGAEALADLMTQLEDLNVFIITHSPDKIMDKVKTIIQVERVHGFSILCPPQDS